jgi:hypothetical protein
MRRRAVGTGRTVGEAEDEIEKTVLAEKFAREFVDVHSDCRYLASGISIATISPAY